jgi:Transposase, Mutator family
VTATLEFLAKACDCQSPPGPVVHQSGDPDEGAINLDWRCLLAFKNSQKVSTIGIQMESFGYSDSPLELRIHAGCGDFSGATTKHQTRWAGFDEKILSLYACGMTVREIQSHLEEMYGTEVSPTLISSVTDAVMDEAKAWRSNWARITPFFDYLPEIRRIISV